MNYRICIVEDEPTIAEPLLFLLQREGFLTTHVALGQEGIAGHASSPFDLVILDVGLPDMSGFDVLRRIREMPTRREVPVIFLTARSEEVDRVVGLELGADDYVVKPFSPREVLARIRAIFRRTLSASDVTTLRWAHEPVAMEIRFNGVVLDLTRYEYRLLAMLLSSPGRVFERSEIMARVWGDAPDTADRTIDAHVKTLRAKLKSAGADGNEIRTWRGIGYSVDPQ